MKNGQVHFLSEELNLSNLIVWSNLYTETPVNSDGSFEVQIDKTDYNVIYAELIHQNAASEDRVSSYFLSSINFSDEQNIDLTYNSSAVAMVWSRLSIDINVDKQKWKEVRNNLSQLDSIINLAQYIEQKLKLDPYSFSFDDIMFQDTLADALNESKEYIELLKTSNLQSQSYIFGQEAVVTPPKQDGIEVYEKDDGTGRLVLENDTMLYMSMEVKTDNGEKIKSHITNYFGNGAINPQYSLFFVSNKEVLDVYGQNCHINLLTAGVDNILSNKIIDALRVKTIVDQLIWPYFGKHLGVEKVYWDDFVLNNITGAIDAGYSNLQNDSLGAMKNIYQSICNDISNPKGTLGKALRDKYGDKYEKILANKLSKIMAKKLAESFAGSAGKLADFAYDAIKIGNLFYDLKQVDSEINFDVKFSLSIKSISPAIVRPDGKDVTFTINGTGFSRNLDINLAYLNEVFPVNNYSVVDREGKEISLRVSGSLLKSIYNQYIKDNGGSLSLEMYPKGQYPARVIKEDAISFSNEVQLTSISPSSGKAGGSVWIEGIGFSDVAGNNEITIGGTTARITQRVLTDGIVTSLYVQVPSSLDVGKHEVKARIKDTNQWSSNTLEYEIIQGNINIQVCDNGSAKDDAFALYVDNQSLGTMYASDGDYCDTLNIELDVDSHTARLVGVEAPDDIGTYSISFSGDITNLQGSATSGRDLIPGVEKKWTFTVSGQQASSTNPMVRETTPYAPSLERDSE